MPTEIGSYLCCDEPMSVFTCVTGDSRTARGHTQPRTAGLLANTEAIDHRPIPRVVDPTEIIQQPPPPPHQLEQSAP